MLYRALSLAEQGGKRALTTKTLNYSLGSVRSIFHDNYNNENFVKLPVLVNEFGRTRQLSRS